MQTFTERVDFYYDVGYQMTLDLRRRAQEYFEQQKKAKAALTSIEAFEAHRQRVRENFLKAIGGLPGPIEYSQRTPPPFQITGTIERDGFNVEKLIYESLPSFPVTAACYVPKALDARAPAVVVAHGHANNGKAHTTYQQLCIDLAQNGFVVLAVDPIAQGERFQVVEGGERKHYACAYEHTHDGTPFWLHGASIARHFIWDIMRGMDYLQSRKDVDASRIAITGSSGGGTQTCYLMMCEPRLAAAVPCTFVMTLESYQETGQPQDAEQIIRGCMAHGPDHDDFLTAMAPRPVLVGAAAYDFFPIEGSHEAVRRAKNIYTLYGKEENVDIAVAPTTHEYSSHLREACVNWLRLHLQKREPDFVTQEPPISQERELWVTTSGSVYRDNPTIHTAFELNREAASPARRFQTIEEKRQALVELLGISAAGDRSAPIYPRIISKEFVDGFSTEKIFFFSAPDIVVTGVLVHPRGAIDDPLPTTMLLLEHGTDDIPASRALIESILRRGHRVFVFDARGVGAVKEYLQTGEGEFKYFNNEYKNACDAMMLGLSTLGLRVFDVLRGIDYLQSRDDVGEVHLHGVRSGASFAFFAAVLEENIASLTAEEMICSYRDICQTIDYTRELHDAKIFAWGLLQYGDIMDHLDAIAPRLVTFLRPRNARGEILDSLPMTN